MYNDFTHHFIQEHINDDPFSLLLSKSKFPNIDVEEAVEQIVSRRKIKDKLPGWYADFNLVFPSKLSSEQCSSEVTARYKQSLTKGKSLCDLTGGLGVDTYHFSIVHEHVIYVEQNNRCYESAKHNFKHLKADNIECINMDCIDYIDQIEHVDAIYIDPARRDSNRNKVVLIEECEPNILAIMDKLLSIANRVIVKMSPMLDITDSLRKLSNCFEVHVVSVKNECKELLFLLSNHPPETPVSIVCINFRSDGTADKTTFSHHTKASKPMVYAQEVRGYLYEPNSSVMKSNLSGRLCEGYDVEKLQVNSHLFTSDNPIKEFPGRSFQTVSVAKYNKSELQKLAKLYPKANITCRNFPLSAEQIRKVSRIEEGGENYLFFTTLSDQSKVIISTIKV